MLLWMIVDDLEVGRGSIADGWSPPMTAEGQHVLVAREIERRLRAFWKRYANAGQRNSLYSGLKRLVESDDVFQVAPADAHDELRRIRGLLARVVEAGVA